MINMDSDGRIETGINVEDGAMKSGVEPMLSVRNLSTTFHTANGSLKAVDDVSFDLNRNETLGVVGESGSGKSVMVRSVMGLIAVEHGVEQHGSVLFDGVDIAQLPLRRLREMWGSDIGMVLQDPMTSLNPVTRVGHQIVETLRRHTDISRGDAKRRAVQLLQDVGIADPHHRVRLHPHELSGGMRQRVTIAIALAANPNLLIGDEPTTALDVTVQQQILNLLSRVQAEREMAMILVTHDLGVVRNHSDKIIVMYAGRVVEAAPTKSLFAGVKMPYTKALLDSLPRLNLPSHSRLRAISGSPPNLLGKLQGCRFSPRCPAAQDICRNEEAPLAAAADDPTHQYRCWFPVGSSEYEESLPQIDSGNPVSGGAR
jgi:oligopeptide/dipeptide ABC transporter ATP-binding protein